MWSAFVLPCGIKRPKFVATEMAAFESPGVAQQGTSPRSSPAQPAAGGLLLNGVDNQNAAFGHPVGQAVQSVQSVLEAPGMGQSVPVWPEATQ